MNMKVQAFELVVDSMRISAGSLLQHNQMNMALNFSVQS
jgi:hypothetical protein